MEKTTTSDSLLAFAASRLKAGSTTESVRADLFSRGIDAREVDVSIAEAAAGNRRHGLRRGVLFLIIGIVCSVLGIGITAGTYAAATQHGGTYFVTYGLLGFGVGYTIGGVIRIITAISKGI